jgi:outer membrane lipoprotein SlyB
LLRQSKEKKQTVSRFNSGILMGVSVIFLTFSGCTGEMTGQVLGGSMGALIGSQIGCGTGNIVATAIGAVAGMALGGALGKKFDEADKKRAEMAAQKAACTGRNVTWENPSTGAYGTWQAGPVQYDPQHRPHRQLKCLATQPDGRAVNLFVDAYQGSDGNWYMAQGR